LHNITFLILFNFSEKISAENATDELIDGLLEQMAATTAQSLTTMMELDDPIEEGQQNDELMEENRGEEEAEKYGDELALAPPPSIDLIQLESASQGEETDSTNPMGTTTTANTGNDERKKVRKKFITKKSGTNQ
jgi:hypothetical protein